MKSHIDPYEISMIQFSNRKINIFSLSHPGPGFDYHYSCIVKGILNLQHLLLSLDICLALVSFHIVLVYCHGYIYTNYLIIIVDKPYETPLNM